MSRISEIFHLLGGLALVAAVTGCTLLPGSPVIEIDAGRLEGLEISGTQAFRGIPYAAPPIGKLRWRAPQAVAPWDGVRSAAAYGPHCAQVDTPILWFELDTVSEDCLRLNVLKPANHSGRLPVMVWIHGGGYTNGSGNTARLNSAPLAREGVVLVTLNYRLTIFGFLTHPALTATQPDEPVGNLALLDIVAALKWVRTNIAAFGGDPHNVTIFGESAGAGLVNTLLVMPASEGLFHRAISESASVGLAPDPYPNRKAGFLPASYKAGTSYAKKLGIDHSAEDAAGITAKLRSFSTRQLLDALSDRDRFTPVIDGETVPDQVGLLTAQGRQHAVPYITGGNSWEASLGRQIGGGFSPEFSSRLVPAAEKKRLYPGLAGSTLDDQIFGDLIVLSGSRYSAEQMAKRGVPVYSYLLSYVAEDRRKNQPGAAHTDDIAFIMQTLDSEDDLSVVTEQDKAISRLMSAYWVQFAKTGDPNRPDLPEWPAYDARYRRTLEIGDEILVHEHLMRERMTYHITRGLELLERASR